MGQDIRRLTNLAYPTATEDLHETLAKDQFIDSLISVDMGLRIKQARPTSLNDAVRHAVELEAFNRAEKSRLSNQGILNATASSSASQEGFTKHQQDELQKLKSTVERLERELQRFSKTNLDGKQQTTENIKRDRRCFECGSKFHVRPNCPKLKDKKPFKKDFKKDKKDDGKDRSAANAVGPGLYIHVDFYGQILNCLVDTGASLSVISTRVWENSDISKQGVLNTYDKTIITASGSALDVRGKTKITLKISDTLYDTEVIIANIENDMLMGLDFMEKHGCTVDILNNTLVVKGKKVDLIGCHRIIAKADEEIPAMSEKIINGKVLNMTGHSTDLFIIEQSEIKKDNIGLIARALVQGNETVPLRIMNVTDEPQNIRTGTNLVILSPICEVKSNFNKSMNAAIVPEHLKDLYERTVAGMSREHCEQVAKLLRKYSTIFSKSDADLGRTGIVRHKIDTQDAYPIKQPLRRSPVHLNDEIDKQIDDMLQRDIIQPSKSPWASGIVMVTKKDGSNAFVSTTEN